MRSRRKRNVRWWRNARFGDLALAFGGFETIGGPPGFEKCDMVVGKNEMAILRDCRPEIAEAWPKASAYERRLFSQGLSDRGREIVHAIIGEAPAWTKWHSG